MPPPPPTLPDELLEEIFLRLPADEPACLVRASLASKLWLSLLTGPAFRGRYREHHGAPPMLGFLLSWLPWDKEKRPGPAPHFIPTAKFGPRVPDSGHMEYDSLDCRHGRVLLADTSAGFSDLAVWDPMTGCRRMMKAPAGCVGLGAAVLCPVTGCDHRSCHEGPFQVLLFGLSTNDGAGSAHAWVCSSEAADQWSEPGSPLQLGSGNALIQPRPSLLFDYALYHTVVYDDHIAILKYDIASNCMSLIDGPRLPRVAQLPILMAMEDDSPRFTYFNRFTLYRMSRHVGADGVATWSQRMVVDLKDIIPFRNPKNEFRLVGFKEDDSGTIFVTTDLGIYEINIKSLEWKKLWKRENIRALIPYMSFYHAPERVNPL